MQIFIIRAFSFDSLKKIVNFGANKQQETYKYGRLKEENQCGHER